MTLLLLVLILSLGVFFVAFISPKKGTRAQQHSRNILDLFLDKVKHWPGWIQTVITKPPIVSHKTVSKSADLGKTARKKAGSIKRDDTQG
jgi:hypothetical protein